MTPEFYRTPSRRVKSDRLLVLDLMQGGRLDTAGMVSSVIGLDDVPAMFERLRGPNPHAKVLIDPSR